MNIWVTRNFLKITNNEQILTQLDQWRRLSTETDQHVPGRFKRKKKKTVQNTSSKETNKIHIFYHPRKLFDLKFCCKFQYMPVQNCFYFTIYISYILMYLTQSDNSRLPVLKHGFFHCHALVRQEENRETLSWKQMRAVFSVK